MCQILKKLSKNLQPLSEVIKIVSDTTELKKGNDNRILAHLLSYAENQFGPEVTGVGYRERADGIPIDKWNVDIHIFATIYSDMIFHYQKDNSISRLIRNDAMFSILKRLECLLSPWLVRIDSLEKKKKFRILFQLSVTEQELACITMERNVLAEGHCQRCLSYAKTSVGLEGDKKNLRVSESLQTYSELRQRMSDMSGAVAFAEEA
jgi:hypothetical protein